MAFRSRIALVSLLAMALAVGALPLAGAQEARAEARARSGVGLAVVAAAGAEAGAWELARLIYATPALAPAALDEPSARALMGEKPPTWRGEALDLFFLRQAVRGEDVASGAILGEIAHRLRVSGIVLARLGDADTIVLKVFDTAQSRFDPARYNAPQGAPWGGIVASLARAWGNRQPSAVAGTSARAAEGAPPRPGAGLSVRRSFFESGWFWGALGAAVLGGGAIYLATRDNGPETIHLRMQVPP